MLLIESFFLNDQKNLMLILKLIIIYLLYFLNYLNHNLIIQIN